MTPHTCGCSPVALRSLIEAARRGHGRSQPHAARGRHAGDSGSATGAAASAAPSVKGYSPPPPAVSPTRGLIDFHTHAAPDVMGRAVDDEQLASFALAREMEALMG